MKRITMLLAAGLLTLATTRASSDQAHKTGHGASMEMAGVHKTITGEVVDTGCYLGHGARGEKHISCATKCINQGMPMALLTTSGTLYLLTVNHDNADPYNGLKTMAGKTVSVTGTVMSRGGMNAIDVSEFKPVTKSAGK